MRLPRFRIRALMVAVAVVGVLMAFLLWVHETADRWGESLAFQFVYAAFFVFFYSAPTLARILDRWQRGG